jgi:hypothetical protein
MYIHRFLTTRQLGVAAVGAMAAGFVTAGTASAAPVLAPSASVANNTLTILGTSGDDAITIGLAVGDPNTLLFDSGGGRLPQAFDLGTFNAITVSLGRGDDVFGVVASSGTLTGQTLTVDGDAGNDTIVGGPGNDILSGGAGDDTISGGDGNDLIFGDGGNDVITGGRGNDDLVLGGGDDTAVWNPGDGSDVVDGGAGTDAVDFNGSNANENMSLSANGEQAVFLRDVAAIRMDLGNIEQFNLTTVGGADNVTVNDLTGTDIRQANIDLSAQGTGDGQPDTVTVNGTNKADHIQVAANGAAVDVSGLHTDTQITGGEVALDHLQVNSLGGNDTVDVGSDATALIPVTVDLGTGQR